MNTDCITVMDKGTYGIYEELQGWFPNVEMALITGV